MKRAILLMLCLLLLSGCGASFSNEYISVSEHDDPFAYKEETSPVETEASPQTASDYYGLRAVARSFVVDGVEDGQLRLVSYNGDVERDLKRLESFLTEEDPICAYALDYVDFQHSADGADRIVSVHMTFRRSVSEIKSIATVRGGDTALSLFEDALTQFQPSLTIQISGYPEEDMTQTLYKFCSENPDLIPEIPAIALSVYPQSGNVRVVEAHFTYSGSGDTLRAKRAETESVLTSAYNFVPQSASDAEKLSLLGYYLTNRFPYTEDPDASVYDLLHRGSGNSKCIASVVSYICRRFNVECSTVHGTRDGADYDWCIVKIDDQYRHFDLHRVVLDSTSALFMSDDEMEGYEWDRDAYPSCEGPEPVEEE